MKAVVVNTDHKLKIVRDCPEPVVNDYTALIKIETCGFCNGTDIRIINDRMPFPESFPAVLGHEGCGTVVEIGKRVRHIKTGEKHIRIRNSNSPDNRYSYIHGHMAEYGVITDHAAMKEDGLSVPPLTPLIPALIPAEFDYADGSLVITLCECLSAVKNFGVNRQSDVLVFGAGPMGQAFIRFMILTGVGSVTCVDPDGGRLARLNAVSGSGVRVIDTSVCDIADALGDQRFDRVIDAVGESGVIYTGAKFLKPGGVVCSFGVLCREDRLIDTYRLPNNTSLHMLNFPYGKYETMDELFTYIKTGLIHLHDFYTHTAAVEDIEDVIEAVKTHRCLKTVLTI